MSAWYNFKTWRDIKDWAESHGFDNLVARMELNNRCWNCSGEFGRNQVIICDSIRNAKTEPEAIKIANRFNEEMEKNYGLY